MDHIKTQTKEIDSFNIIGVEAGTNCPQGGDSGHGGRTYLKMQNISGTSWAVRIKSGDLVVYVGSLDTVELFLGGDTECDTFTEALRFAADTLREQSQELPEGVEPGSIPTETISDMLRY